MSGYDKRIVAFADILGWTSACTRPLQYADLAGAANGIANYAANFSPRIKEALAQAPGVAVKHVEEHSGIEFAFFSDNFVVSAPVDRGRSVFDVLVFSFHELLRLGFLLRGGITVGDLHHDSRVVFGPALVEAVEMERRAGSPGVHCSDELGKFAGRNSYKAEVMLADLDNKLVVNMAAGSLHALSDLQKIVAEHLAKPMEFAHRCKWQYVAEMLQRMYVASGK